MIAISKNIGKGRVNLLCYEINNSQGNARSMKIQEIEITDIGGIPYLKLDNLDPHMNIISGENGVGKTNILDSISAMFSLVAYELKKRTGSDFGRIKTTSKDGDTTTVKELDTDAFEPNQRNGIIGNFYHERYPFKSLVYIKVNRVFGYEYIESLKRSPDPENYEMGYGNYNLGMELKNWFIQTHLLDKSGELDEVESYNIGLARKFLNTINPSYRFKKTNKFYEIIISSPSGDIYFEYLSSGFKSCFFILLGILREIEYKFGSEVIPANEFDGIILIDEIELHLHPEWQARIIKILKESFPQAQFFITTHSPHVIQSASYNEIIALEKRNGLEDGVLLEVVKRKLPNSPKYGFQGWTIEEILTDVMGMSHTRGNAYEEQMKLFDLALEDGDPKKAKEAYQELAEMLHPDSHVRKMLQIQMAGLR